MPSETYGRQAAAASRGLADAGRGLRPPPIDTLPPDASPSPTATSHLQRRSSSVLQTHEADAGVERSGMPRGMREPLYGWHIAVARDRYMVGCSHIAVARARARFLLLACRARAPLLSAPAFLRNVQIHDGSYHNHTPPPPPPPASHVSLRFRTAAPSCVRRRGQKEVQLSGLRQKVQRHFFRSQISGDNRPGRAFLRFVENRVRTFLTDTALALSGPAADAWLGVCACVCMCGCVRACVHRRLLQRHQCKKCRRYFCDAHKSKSFHSCPGLPGVRRPVAEGACGLSDSQRSAWSHRFPTVSFSCWHFFCLRACAMAPLQWKWYARARERERERIRRAQLNKTSMVHGASDGAGRSCRCIAVAGIMAGRSTALWTSRTCPTLTEQLSFARLVSVVGNPRRRLSAVQQRRSRILGPPNRFQSLLAGGDLLFVLLLL